MTVVSTVFVHKWCYTTKATSRPAVRDKIRSIEYQFENHCFVQTNVQRLIGISEISCCKLFNGLAEKFIEYMRTAITIENVIYPFRKSTMKRLSVLQLMNNRLICLWRISKSNQRKQKRRRPKPNRYPILHPSMNVSSV